MIKRYKQEGIDPKLLNKRKKKPTVQYFLQKDKI